jgi:hypothetical protein
VKTSTFLPLVFTLILSALQMNAAPPKSLLPPIGADGREFTVKAQGTHVLRGWLPKDWTDNSEWAAVTGSYTKLTDPPEPSVAAVRIKIEKVDEGQLQLTSYQGNQSYQQGKTYKVTGWVGSPDRLTIKVGARQIDDPYEMYHEQDLSTQSEWKPFEFVFKPAKDFKAFIMFVVNEVGTVDLAGVSVVEATLSN